MTDQQRWDTVGAYGNPMGLTPNIDQLARRGTRLERAFTPQPLCTPSRACIQTGQYATTHGVWKNNVRLPETEHAVAQEFRRNGYQTGYIGKWHLNCDKHSKTDPVPASKRAGYEYWRAADGLEHTSHPYEGFVYNEEGEQVPLDGYRVDALTDLAVSFIRDQQADPFFLFLSHVEPHPQHDLRPLQDYVAPDGYAEQYGSNPYIPPDLIGRDGSWYESLPDYYGMCKRIDESVGRLLDELEHQGLDEDTIVVFTSDHGNHFKTRNQSDKRSCHDASTRVPAILGGQMFDTGRSIEQPVSLVDLAPTLLDAAGIDVPEPMQGDSMLPLLEGFRDDWKDEVFIQTSETEVGRALRTRQWKYSVFAPDKNPERSRDSDEYVERHLYDVESDPGERDNLIGNENYQQITADLRERLVERMVETGEDRPEIVEARNRV